MKRRRHASRKPNGWQMASNGHGFGFATPGHSVGGDIRHRNRISQPDPIRLRPSKTLIGAPIRDLDPQTRALIDDALRRAS